MPYERGKEWNKATPLLPLRRYLLFIANKSGCPISWLFLSRVGDWLELGFGLILLILPVLVLLVVADVIENRRMLMAKMPLIPEDWWLVYTTLQLYRELQRLVRRIHLQENWNLSKYSGPGYEISGYSSTLLLQVTNKFWKDLSSTKFYWICLHMFVNYIKFLVILIYSFSEFQNNIGTTDLSVYNLRLELAN